jgi:SH3-like domain-containing protein
MKIDRDRFFAGYSTAFKTPSESQKAGINALLDAVEGDTEITDVRWLAYMLATVKHECADTWKAIEEYGKGSGRKYGVAVTVTDPADGKQYTNVYYGRGYVQLTWDYNYKNMGTALKNRLLYEPSLALHADVAYRIMSHGMRKGSFTGKKLADYIAGEKCDYVNARRIINGTDQADRIAGYATKLETVLRDSAMAAVPGGVPTPVAAPVSAPAAPAGSGPRFTVTATSLNVRGGPDRSAAPVAGSPLKSGAVVEGLEDSGDWKRIRSVDGGVTGWASAAYLQAAPAPPAAPRFTVTASVLNVRSGPDKATPAVAGSPLAGGTVVEGLEDSGGWKRIRAVDGGVTGWVSASYLQPAVTAGV